MTESPLLPLLGWCALLALLSGLLLARTMPPRALIACLLVKYLIPMLYFGWFADGTWTLIDDLTYLRQGLELAGEGYTPISVLVTRTGLGHLVVLSEGIHILYGWFNLVAVQLVGPYYFSPVILNVFITCLTARVLWGFARDAGFGPRFSSGLTGFYLLHWDVVAWSAFVNVKDSIIVLLTMLLLRSLACFQQAPARRELLRALAVSAVLFWIRFYVPALAGLAMLIRGITSGTLRPKHRWVTLLIAAVVLAGMGWLIQSRWLAVIQAQLQFNPLQLGVGLVRMLLTPQPWSVSPEYGFLLLPSMLHLLMLVPAVVGAMILWRDSPMLRLPIVYAVLVLVLFAAFPGQQGPRYRHQVVFVLVWAQFTFIWQLLRAAATDFAVVRPPMRLST